MQPDSPLWVSADIPASADYDQFARVQIELLGILRDMVRALGQDDPKGDATIRHVYMRHAHNPAPSLCSNLLTSCDDPAKADMVRVTIECQPPAYGPQTATA